MSAPSPRPLDQPRFALLDRLVRSMQHDTVPTATRAAVSTLTANADPDRAARLAVRAGEPAALVERLAVWALHRADDDAVVAARRIVDAASTDGPVDDRAEDRGVLVG